MAPKPKSKASACFAVPRAAINALLQAQADAVTIGAYLVLACHTDESGKFSTAGLHAIREQLGVNRDRADKAIRLLATLNGSASAPNLASKGKGRLKIVPSPPKTLPLIYTREAWDKVHGEKLPDGPTDRSRIRYILPTFEESLDKRVWISSELVHGDDVIEQPLRALKDCGNVAARSLLALYAGQDLDRWYGIPPHGFAWIHYALEERTTGALRILLAAKGGQVVSNGFSNHVHHLPDSDPCFEALHALEHAGLLYESIVLLNRNPIPDKFTNGDPYGNIPEDAEILCDLSTPSPWGPAPERAWGLGKVYMDTVNEIAKQRGYPDAHVFFDAWKVKKYDHLAVVAIGHPAMIAGLYRLRFRVTNPKNAFVEEATRRHLDASATAFKRLNYLRQIKKLDPLIRTLQSSSIPLQSSSMYFNISQPNIYGEGSREGNHASMEKNSENALPLDG